MHAIDAKKVIFHVQMKKYVVIVPRLDLNVKELLQEKEEEK